MSRTRKFEKLVRRHVAGLSPTQLARAEALFGLRDPVTGMVTVDRLVLSAVDHDRAAAEFDRLWPELDHLPVVQL